MCQELSSPEILLKVPGLSRREGGASVGGVACRGGAGANTGAKETEAGGDGKGLEGKSGAEHKRRGLSF